MSRRIAAPFLSALAILMTAPLGAQDAEPPERIDILVKQPPPEQVVEDCTDEQEAAIISGEIVVCRRLRDQSDHRYSSPEEAESRYAYATRGRSTPDVFGIPDHGVVVARGCFIPPCPTPMPVLIDIEALPEAPPGSDADRIARGLPPLGRDGEVGAGEEGLALPEVPDFADEDASPEGSGAPEGVQ